MAGPMMVQRPQGAGHRHARDGQEQNQGKYGGILKGITRRYQAGAPAVKAARPIQKGRSRGKTTAHHQNHQVPVGNITQLEGQARHHGQLQQAMQTDGLQPRFHSKPFGIPE